MTESQKYKSNKKIWKEEERKELCQRLDNELDKHLDSLPKTRYKDGWTEENWKEKMADHPLFAPYVAAENPDAEAPLNELSEGLAQLKYGAEDNTPLEIAQNYKEEGIHYFKLKKYRFAVASFSEALKQKFDDDKLRAQLYNNRAAAHQYLMNNKSAISNCEKALQCDPQYRKVILRAISIASSLGSWQEVLDWCNKGLLLNPTDEEILSHRCVATEEKKKFESSQRRKAQEVKVIQAAKEKLLNVVRQRGINIYLPDERNTLELCDLEPKCHYGKIHEVHLSEKNELVWPVFFLYPEYSETDLIQEFNENDSFLSHLEVMFGNNCESAAWDLDHSYKYHNLSVFFEFDDILCELTPKSTLKEALSDKRYVVKGGTPSFIILVRNSQFMRNFKDGYR